MNPRTPRRLCRSRDGIALPAALLILTLLALFLAGSAFVALQESRSASNALGERRALEAAEYGAAALLRDWDPRWNLATRPGDTLGPWMHALAGGASAVVRATRATPTAVWAVSEGTAGMPAVDRRARRGQPLASRLRGARPADGAKPVPPRM